MRCVRHVSQIGEMRNAYKILVEKFEGKSPLGIPRRRWEDNIRTNLREMGWEGMDWIHLTQYRGQRRALVNMVTNL